jgi:hypothetical protein
LYKNTVPDGNLIVVPNEALVVGPVVNEGGKIVPRGGETSE